MKLTKRLQFFVKKEVAIGREATTGTDSLVDLGFIKSPRSADKSFEIPSTSLIARSMRVFST
jgi:hypothetical protein